MNEIETMIMSDITEDTEREAAELTAREARRGGRPRGAKKDDDLQALATRADTAIAAATDLVPVTTARQAIEVLDRAVTETLFPSSLSPLDDAVLRDFQLLVAAMPAGYTPVTQFFIEAHAQAVAHHPDLARCIRSIRGRRLVQERARMGAVGDPTRAARLEAKALGSFQTAIAEQLHGRTLDEPAAGIYIETLPRLRADLALIEQRLVDEAADEQRRLAEDAATAQQRQQQEETAAREREWAEQLRVERDTDPPAYDRRMALARWYDGEYRAFTFRIEGESLTGAECARRLRAGDEFQQFYRAQTAGTQPSRLVRL